MLNIIFEENSLKATTPTMADKICPPIRFLGCARGELTAP